MVATFPRGQHDLYLREYVQKTADIRLKWAILTPKMVV